MKTVSDFLFERLSQWNVERIFGYSGDGINGLTAALDRAKDRFEFVQVRHEEMAAFMATGHAKYTGEVGVCLATSGPGAIHLLNGLYDAKEDRVPVLAIVGQAATSAIGAHYQQEIDLGVLFKDVAHEFVTTVTSPLAMRHAIDRAMRIAMATRSVTCLIVPKDVQELAAADKIPRQHNMAHSGVGYQKPRVIPAESDLARAAAVLNAGTRVAMLVGAGAAGAVDEIVAVADRLGAGCAKALLGKATMPDDLPWVTGDIGLLGTRPSSDMMDECDTLFLIGTSFPYDEFLPKEGQARGVQIDIDGKNLGLRYAMEVNLAGDSADTLRALLPLLHQKTHGSWREKIAKNRAEWADVNATRAAIAGEDGQLNPEVVFTELSKRLPDRCILSADAGTSANWSARHLKMRRGMKFSLSGSLATMGPAVPYAIAAKFAFPDRVAIALTGDGAMQMNGNAELITIGKYWRRWSDPRLIVMVLNNRDLNQVTWEMRIESGDPKFAASQDLPDFPYARYAEMLGFVGIKVERAEDVGAAWDRALAADRPALIEAFVDPNISIIPPHITFEQAKNMTSALAKGDPNELGIMLDSAKSVIAGLLPNRHDPEGM
ncbi:MAG: thiamine pyrophosphate-requiring protein [Candidatus Eremiobacteraeota bacterium]|nr:thiamine pyrophosphate-requiring protein [Candidatus Eremiobacteraeota bacterium]